MADQMHLFPADEEPGAPAPTNRGEIHPVDEVFYSVPDMRDGAGYVRMLETVACFPQYSPFNGFLLYLQKPDARQVATAATWSRQFRRIPRRGARPLIILAPMSPVHFVFERDETEGDPLAQDTRKERSDASLHPKHLRKVYDRTVHNAALHGVVIRHAQSDALAADPVMPLTYDVRKRHASLRLEAGSSYLVFLDPGQSIERRLAALVFGLGHIFCGHMGIDSRAWWEDRRDIERRCAEIEAESAAFLACRRRGDTKASEAFLRRFRNRDVRVPPISLHRVLHAVHYIEEMGRKRWKAPQRQSRYSAR